MGGFTLSEEVLGYAQIAQFKQVHELDLLYSGDDEYHSMDESGFENLQSGDPKFRINMTDYYRVDTSREYDEIYLRFEAYHSTRESGDLLHIIGAEYEDIQGLDRIWSDESLERGDASGNYEWHTQTVDDGEGIDFVDWLDNYGRGNLHFLQTVEEGWSTGGWRVRNAEIHYPVVDNPSETTDASTEISVDEAEYVDEAWLSFDYERLDGNPNHWLTVYLGDQIVVSPTDLDGDSGRVETNVNPFIFEDEGTTAFTFVADGGASSHLQSHGCEYRIENVTVEWTVQEQDLSVDSTPDNADVYLDGDYVGETPHTVSVSPFEEFDVEVDKGNYKPQTFGNVSPPASIHADLDPEEDTLEVTSAPDGADVYLDGSRVGTTPWSAQRPVTNSYDVRVEKDGYGAESRSGISPPEGVHFDLDPEEGTLEVTSAPDGADVYVDDSHVGTTPWSAQRPVTNSYDIRVEKQDYETASRSGVSPPESIDFDLDPQEATLEVTSSPDGAGVYLDDSYVGTTPWSAQRPVTNSYDVRVEKDGYNTASSSGISPPEGVHFDLGSEEAAVEVASWPDGADVYLDGSRVGTTPWSDELPVTNSYDVRVEKQNYQRETFENYSPPWLIEADLDPQEDTLEVTSEPDGAAVYLDNSWVGTTPWSAQRPVTNSYDVRVEKDGYGEETRTDVSPPDGVHFDLDTESGTLKVTSSPDGADVYLDDSHVGTTTWSGERPVTNSYDIRVEKDGYQTASRSSVSPPGLVDFDLDPQEATLEVTSSPDGADVYLDGSRVGTTPWSDQLPSSDSYDVRVEKDGYRTETRSGVTPTEIVHFDLVDTSISVDAESMTVGGRSSISLSGTYVDRIVVSDLWTDWTIVDAQKDEGSFHERVESAGECQFDWDSSRRSVSTSLTVEPPADTYKEGRYVLEVTAKAPDNSATASAVLQIE